MTSVLLRDAVPDDAPALAGIFRRASLDNDGDHDALLARPDVLLWRGPPGPPRRCRVAIDGASAAAAGFATTVPVGRDLELEDLFVDPAWMRRGVGTALIVDVRTFARSRGAGRITVDANPHALAFYESVGFVVDATTATELGPGLRMHGDV